MKKLENYDEKVTEDPPRTGGGTGAPDKGKR